MESIRKLWQQLYDENGENELSLLMTVLEKYKSIRSNSIKESLWYKNSVVYSVYIERFGGTFKAAQEKLSYLKELGVTALWILPVLSSPMKDQGFDISDYYNVRGNLGTNEDFFDFIHQAHMNGIRVIFDIAINHTSSSHEWFIDARKSKESKYRDYYIWNDTPDKYARAGIVFDGIMKSNWEYNDQTSDYYFHRFYDSQPDLNYSNPRVILEMINILLFWQSKDIDGFRMDAAPYLSKQEGTDCYGLEKSHYILKIFRACLDYVSKGTVLLAEANEKPIKVVKYFGNDDECHCAYNFPLMTGIFSAIAKADPKEISELFNPLVMPEIPSSCQWFNFLRCHDELSLEAVGEEEKKNLVRSYLLDERWNFRKGAGISARTYDLFCNDYKKTVLAFSVLFSLDGNPVIYYGDEIGMKNDYEFYEKIKKETGYDDTRYLMRSNFDVVLAQKAIEGEDCNEKRIYDFIKYAANLRRCYRDLFLTAPEISSVMSVLKVKRRNLSKQLIVYNNLAAEYAEVDGMKLEPYEARWIISYC